MTYAALAVCFPVTDKTAYFNTAAVGLASRALVHAYRHFVGLIGADPSDVALIASVSPQPAWWLHSSVRPPEARTS